MAKNIEINIKGSDGSYEVLYPKVNPDILKLDSSNIQIDSTLGEKLGLSDGANLSDMLGKIETGVLCQSVIEEKDYKLGFNPGTISGLNRTYNNDYYAYGKGVWVLYVGSTLYYTGDLKITLTKCSGVPDTGASVGKIFYCDNGYFYCAYNNYLYYSNNGIDFNQGFDLRTNSNTAILIKVKYLNEKLYVWSSYTSSDGETDYYQIWLSSDNGKTKNSVYLSSDNNPDIFYFEGIGYFLITRYSNEYSFTKNSDLSNLSKKTISGLTSDNLDESSLQANYLFEHKGKIIFVATGSYKVCVCTPDSNGDLNGIVMSNASTGKKYLTYSGNDMYAKNNNICVFFCHWFGKAYYCLDFTDSEDAFVEITLPSTILNFSYYNALVEGDGSFCLIPNSSYYLSNNVPNSTSGKIWKMTCSELQSRLFNMTNQEIKLVIQSVLGLEDIVKNITKIEIGTYTGTGSNGVTLASSFSPQIVFIEGNSSSRGGGLTIAVRDKLGYSYNGENGVEHTATTWNTNSVKISNSSSSGSNNTYFNGSNIKFNYVILG